MYFISNKSNLRFVVRSDVTEPIYNAVGTPNMKVHSPVVYAQFRSDRHVPREFREFAVTYFNNPSMSGMEYQRPGLGGGGPLVTQHAGVTGLGEQNDGVTIDGQAYGADDPHFKLGILDTANETHVAPEHRELVETTLLGNSQLGKSYIKFDTALPLPWPAYAKLTTKPEDIKKLLQRVSDLEDDGQANAAEYVIQFEEATDKRVTIIKAVEEYLAEKAAVA